MDRLAKRLTLATLLAGSGCDDPPPEMQPDATTTSGGGGTDVPSSATGTAGSSGSSETDESADVTGTGAPDEPSEDRFRLLCARLTGSALIVEEIDPQSGAQTELGQLSDLESWSGEFVVNADGTQAHVLGVTQPQLDRDLHTLALDTGESWGVPVDATHLAGTRRDGTVVAFEVDTDAMVADALVIDPDSGQQDFAGQTFPAASWNGSTAYDRERGLAYFVETTKDAPSIYRINLDDGGSAESFPVTLEATLIRGVRTNGELIGVWATNPWNGVNVVRNQLGGEIETYVSFEQIAATDFHMAYDTAGDRGFLGGFVDPDAPGSFAVYAAEDGAAATLVAEVEQCVLAKY